jgi:hypothetical protein
MNTKMKNITLLSGIAMLAFISDIYGQPLVENLTSKTKQSGTLYSTPSVPQAAYFAGANPCLVGVGAGGSGGPVGLSFAMGRSDESCQRRSDAGAWHSLGFDDIAFARMCEDLDNQRAVEATGRHCPHGSPMVSPASSTPAPATTPLQPTPIQPPNQAPPPKPVVENSNQNMVSNAPSWCKYANRTDRLNVAYIHQMCGG